MKKLDIVNDKLSKFYSYNLSIQLFDWLSKEHNVKPIIIVNAIDTQIVHCAIVLENGIILDSVNIYDSKEELLEHIQTENKDMNCELMSTEISSTLVELVLKVNGDLEKALDNDITGLYYPNSLSDKIIELKK